MNESFSQTVENHLLSTGVCRSSNNHLQLSKSCLGRGPWCSGYSCLHGKSEIADLNPTLAFKFEKKNVSFLLTPKDLILWGASVSQRKRARSQTVRGGGPRVVVSTAAFHARVRGSVPGLGGLKETKMFLPHPRVKVSIVGSLRDWEVACSASERQGSNFESCVWRTVSSHHPQEVLLAQFSLYVHKRGLKPH